MDSLYLRKKSTPAIPILSLIDILAILLIFFVVVSDFKTEEKEKKTSIDITPPTTEQLTARVITEARVTLAITSDGTVYLDDDEIPMHQLVPRLVALKEERPEMKLELMIDQNVTYKTSVEVWDSLTAAGYDFQDLPTRIQLKSPQL